MSHIPPDYARSPVFDQASRPHPGLIRPGSSWGMGAAVIGACVLGVITFLSLNNHRIQRQTPAPQVAAVGPPAPVLPKPAAVVAPPPPAIIQAPPPAAPQIAPQVSSDPHAPAMVVDFSQAPAAGAVTTTPGTAVAQAGGTPATGAAAASDEKLSADERFSARISGSNVDVAHASRIHDLSHTAPQGTVIPAVLETAINSDLPGFVRAVVSRDVRGFDGTTVLIPRGSKLIGQYRSGVALSQTRAFVVWSRVITPDGVSIDIGSPGTDQLGRGGLEGETDTHFFERFGSAILLSVMGAGLERLADSNDNNNTAIIIGSQQQASQVASIALQKQIDIPVTIKVPQGTPLQVFVTRDLDFASVSK
jgi:type IV secretion system protein VirB10